LVTGRIWVSAADRSFTLAGVVSGQAERYQEEHQAYQEAQVVRHKQVPVVDEKCIRDPRYTVGCDENKGQRVQLLHIAL
jgi:hypothetical protein